MERNQRTTAERLKVGDRFYKLKDKKKQSLQIVEHHSKQTKYRTYSLFCCPSLAIDNKLMSDVLKKSQYSPILKDTEVVFLRHVNEISGNNPINKNIGQLPNNY